MILCSCTALTKANIIAAAEALSRAAPGRVVTPGRIFRALGVKPQCAVCFTIVRTVIADAGLAFTCPEPLASEAETEDSASAY